MQSQIGSLDYKITRTKLLKVVSYLGAERGFYHYPSFGSSQLTEAMPFAFFPKMSPGMNGFVEDQKETTAYGEGESSR